MIIQRLFGKVLRDKHALELAEKRLKGMRQKQRNFLKSNLEKTVITKICDFCVPCSLFLLT